MPRQTSSCCAPLKLPGGGLRAPCRSFSLHLLVGPCHSEEKWIRHGCLSNRAHLFSLSLSLSLSLSARALVARELRFVLPDPDSRSPKLKFKPCRRQKGKAGRWRGAGACGGLGRSRTYHSPLQTSSSHHHHHHHGEPLDSTILRQERTRPSTTTLGAGYILCAFGG